MAPAQSRTGQRLDHRGLWHLKGQPDVLKNIQVEAQLNHQHLINSPDWEGSANHIHA